MVWDAFFGALLRSLCLGVPRVEDPAVVRCGSGHSFKLAPAIGQCLAELITHGTATAVDITPLRATRFEEGNQFGRHTAATGAKRATGDAA
ncbi:MAG: hypothetical protein QGI09_02815 [Dehalococcoidia bacterium]|nr:hypothetical protein [Dehalococcoidia bacterium]